MTKKGVLCLLFFSQVVESGLKIGIGVTDGTGRDGRLAALFCGSDGQRSGGNGNSGHLIRQLEAEFVEDLRDDGIALLLIVLVAHGVI